jgi:integrase
MWLQASGRVRGLIGEGEDFRIQIDGRGNWIWREKELRPVSTPTLPSIQAIEATMANQATQDPRLNARNEVMMKWQSIVGLRAVEVCQLRIDQMPTRLHAAQLLDQRRPAKVKLTITKGAAYRTVSVHPLLIMETHDWADGDREEIIERAETAARSTGRSFLHPGTVFISIRGTSLNSRAYSNLIRTAFKRACMNKDVENTDRVWSHGLRHRALTDDLNNRHKAGQRAPVLRTMHQAGHRSLRSLEPYIHLVEDDEQMPLNSFKGR